MSKIIKSSGSILFETDSGYESEESWPAQEDTSSLIGMLDELGRILAINGEADLARSTLEQAIARTQADLAA
ncbi:hypothetical protein [Paraburkholderia tropica]|uniref:hypothetical protein n=1 Tax=Paraburkholderia tropica TaxID=92647 RepID=UPI0007ED670E|nr:hypothetical protein [Paraburkholderia tropica]OBR52367.1 hypothetical protein A6456_10745 [Paraburkholderia tropica]